MKQMKYLSALAILIGISACNGTESSAPVTASNPKTELPDTSQNDPLNPGVPSTPATPPQDPSAPRSYTTAVLLFNGTGVSTSDWQNTELILKSMGLSYQLVNSSQMNAMTLDQIASFGTLVVPGGSGGTIYGNLTTTTRLRIRQAVRDYGVGYVGFCAGAWVAVGPEAGGNSTASYGFAVANGSVLPAWYPSGNTSLTAAVVGVSFADGNSRQLVWWGGPSTPEWSGGVVARYDNGMPAISETQSGKGFVVISGPHPEAPQGWRATAGNDSDGLDYEIAKNMINAAISQKPMVAY